MEVNKSYLLDLALDFINDKNKIDIIILIILIILFEKLNKKQILDLLLVKEIIKILG